jgi:cob(I)alamin adenosyltransferase
MAIRITRVYTRRGDKGDTALVGGKRVRKDSLRIEAYGTVDELNSIVGLARAFNHEATASPARDRLEEILKRLQNELFDVGSELATPPEARYEGMFRVGDEQVRALEHLMDECGKDLEALNSFILPGGGRVSAFLHQCRTVCRRAERIVLHLGGEESIGPGPLRYLNRLSDLFFVLSRWIGKQNSEREFLWERGLQSHEHPKSRSPSPSEGADKREPHPSRRSQEKGPPQGERKLVFERNNRSARPEEPPSSGGVSKGARRRKSTVPRG